MAELPSGTVTFLFTDIEGSTQRWERAPLAMSTALARHDALLRDEIERHGGVVFKTVGDAFCAAFATPAPALLACIEAQHRLQDEPWVGIEPIRVRMALHTGAAEVRDGDYFGPALNRVARLLGIGHGGQVLMTHVTADLLRDELPPGIELLDLGEHRLRDIERLEQVVQVIGPDLVAAFPPLRVATTRLNNLPVSRTRFIARDEELDALQNLVERGGVALVTLTGPGGTGKSRLALELAARLVDRFDHGVCFVPLAPVTDPDLVPVAIASALGIPEGAAARPLDGVIGYLGSKRLLLILDNFEQVSAAAWVVAELLGTAVEIKVLVTSRSSLRISGEYEFPVPPMGLPDESTSLDRVPAAVALFADRAASARPGFALDETNAEIIAEISRRLDGLPLAIELAAARIKLLTPAAMLARLDHRLGFLTGGARDLPARQQTLRGAIAWSHELLDDAERLVFARLSVFAGGCTLEAAEYVAAGDLEDLDILDVIASLLDKSLIRQEMGPEEGRFGMLHTIREFGREQLEALGDGAARARHAEYYLRMAEQTAPYLNGPLQLESVRKLAAEHENLRVALEWYRDRAEVSALARLTQALWWYWYLRGHLLEGRQWVDTALEALGAEDRGAHTGVLNMARGSIAMLQADFEVAGPSLDRAREIALELDDRELAARALTIRGQVRGFHGNQRDAARILDQAEREQRAIGDRWGLALTLMFRSMRSWALHEREAARTHALESMRLFDELGDNWGASLPPSVLARLAMEEGNFDEARLHLDRSLRRWTETGDRWALGHVLNGQGDIARMERDYDEAETRYLESLAIFREFGNKNGMASVLHNLGYVRLYQGDHAAARALFRESLELFRALDDRRGVLECVAGLAAVAAGLGEGRRAARLFGAAEGEMDAMGLSREGSNAADYDLAVAHTRSILTEGELDEHWEQGRRMTFEQGVSEALKG